MWLCKKERRILSALYVALNKNPIGEGEASKEAFEYASFTPFLHRYAKPNSVIPPYCIEPMNLSLDVREYVECQAIMKRLAHRKLIDYQPHNSVHTAFVAALTIEGYDLGHKYSNKLIRSGMWFREYKDHWLAFATAIVGGGIIKAAFDWLNKK